MCFSIKAKPYVQVDHPVLEYLKKSYILSYFFSSQNNYSI